MAERVKKRAESEGTRKDDDAIEDRLKIYHRESEPVVDHYRGKGVLVSVDGMGAVDRVTADIEQALQGRNNALLPPPSAAPSCTP